MPDFYKKFKNVSKTNANTRNVSPQNSMKKLLSPLSNGANKLMLKSPKLEPLFSTRDNDQKYQRFFSP